jgi:hypothetical protein
LLGDRGNAKPRSRDRVAPENKTGKGAGQESGGQSPGPSLLNGVDAEPSVEGGGSAVSSDPLTILNQFGSAEGGNTRPARLLRRFGPRVAIHNPSILVGEDHGSCIALPFLEIKIKARQLYGLVRVGRSAK